MSTPRDKIAGQHVTGEGSVFDVPPAAIGRFRVLHQVGAGTCGPVFRATDPELDRAVAIKLFALSLTPERASTLAERLEHLVAHAPPLAAAVSPVAAGLHGHTPYLATTFASGDSLDVALRQFGPAALEDLVPRLRALATALDAAAARGILHGALHPRDVLVSDIDTALTGLGVWPLLGEMGVRLPARRPYRAPELTDAGVSAEGDQFALAALAYEWMTGRRAPALFGLSDMAPLPGAERERMAHVFARALHASPEHRFPSCADFVTAVAEVAADAETSAPPVDAPARRRRFAAPTLPLEAFPAEADDLPLSVGPADMAQPAAHPGDEEEDVQEHQDDVERPAASDDLDVDGMGAVMAEDPKSLEGTALDPQRDEPALRHPTRPMFATAEPVGASASGVGRLAAAALVGVALGVGVGYAICGRGATENIAVSSATAGSEATAPPAVSADTTPSSAPASPAGAPQMPPVQAEQRAPLTGSDVPPGQPPTDVRPPGSGPGTPAREAPTAPSATADVPSGSLLIRSTPAGATVFVDDERRGVTPLALRQLELGTRRVRVQRDGFTVENRQVTLTRGRPSRSLDVRLRRPAPAAPAAAPASPATSSAKTGTLLIESRPSGAMALVNGRSVGATPVTIEDLAPGSYTVQFQLTGFRPLTTTVRVVAGARARAAASLTGAQEPK